MSRPVGDVLQPKHLKPRSARPSHEGRPAENRWEMCRNQGTYSPAVPIPHMIHEGKPAGGPARPHLSSLCPQPPVCFAAPSQSAPPRLCLRIRRAALLPLQQASMEGRTWCMCRCWPRRTCRCPSCTRSRPCCSCRARRLGGRGA